jgi:UDPglucose 6-dehydrogenase
MKIAIFGTGYVGLVTSVCLSSMGNDVMAVDVDEAKIAKLQKGETPIYEPGLEELLDQNLKQKRLRFGTNAQEAVDFAEIIFIAVGTPSNHAGEADLKYVYAVAETIGKFAKTPKIIVTKSTVPVGTSEKVLEKAQAANQNRTQLSIANNPEFLKEGAAINDFMYPDRVVIGAAEPSVFEKMRELYEPFVRKNPQNVITMDLRSSELCKYASNAFLATKISFINDMAVLSHKLGANIRQVREGMVLDKRIGDQFLFPGVGYGGSCFPKDVRALISSAAEFGHEMVLLRGVEKINDFQKKILPKIAKKHFGDLKGKRIALWGLAFKPKTDDMREAPALSVIEDLLKEGASVVAYDPIAMPNTQKMLGNSIDYVEDQYEALKGADALMVVTEWPQFIRPDFEKIKALLKAPVIIDGRNIYSPKVLKDLGFAYYFIGKKGAA